MSDFAEFIRQYHCLSDDHRHTIRVMVQGYMLAAGKEDAFATVDHPDAKVFEVDLPQCRPLRFWDRKIRVRIAFQQHFRAKTEYRRSERNRRSASPRM